MRKRDRGRAHFYRRIRRKNGKMLDGEDQNEQPAAAMAMPGVNHHENAGIVQPTYVRPDLNIGSFIPPLDAEEAAVAWERWFKTFVRKTRFFKVSTLQDKLDALSILEEVETLIETLPDPDDGDVTLQADVKPANEPVNEYHRQAYKLNEHFKTMVNKDSARSKFDCMTQGSRTAAQCVVELRKQADRCQFADRDDSIRTKILQTMNDKQLRREAMLKCLPLDKLLKRAANKEDVERQAREMEKNARDDVNRVYEQRKPKKKPARFHAKTATHSGNETTAQ